MQHVYIAIPVIYVCHNYSVFTNIAGAQGVLTLRCTQDESLLLPQQVSRTPL